MTHKRFLKMMWFSALAAGAGGLVAAIVFVIMATPASLLSPVGLLFMFAIALIAAGTGIAVGLLLGFVPVLILAVILSAVRRWKPFRHVISWTLAGSGFAILIYYFLPVHDIVPMGPGPAPLALAVARVWIVGWALGGAVAATTYWYLAYGKAADLRRTD